MGDNWYERPSRGCTQLSASKWIQHYKLDLDLPTIPFLIKLNHHYSSLPIRIVFPVDHQVLPLVQVMILQFQISSHLMLLPVNHQVWLILVEILVIYFLDYYYLVMQVKTKMITVNVKMKLSHKKDDQTNHRSLFFHTRSHLLWKLIIWFKCCHYYKGEWRRPIETSQLLQIKLVVQQNRVALLPLPNHLQGLHYSQVPQMRKKMTTRKIVKLNIQRYPIPKWIPAPRLLFPMEYWQQRLTPLHHCRLLIQLVSPRQL